jgi:hypothetical protein
MAISIDKVYKTVLAILNKEQRGYLTPDEFNRIARQSQLNLLEQSFYEYNQFLVRDNAGLIGNEYANIPKNIRDKIDILTKTTDLTPAAGVMIVPSDLYRLISMSTASRAVLVEEVQRNELHYIQSSPLTTPSVTYPVYMREGSNYNIYPTSFVTQLTLEYVQVPNDPTWAYTVGSLGQYLYNSASTVDFEIHPSEEVDIVISILSYAGVVIKDPSIVNAAVGIADAKTQSEKTQ